jgi:large subunit ribosomal protein L11
MVKKAAGVEKGSTAPNPLTSHAKLNSTQVREIAERKLTELTAHDIDAAMKTVAGTARSMGIIVEG